MLHNAYVPIANSNNWLGVIPPKPPGCPPGPPAPPPPPPPPPVVTFLPAFPLNCSLSLGFRGSSGSFWSSGRFSSPSKPGRPTSGFLGKEGPEGGPTPGGLGATVVPGFPGEPPKTDSSPGGGGGFRDGLGEPGVAYDLEKRERVTALYRGKRRKLIALNDICVEWREEGLRKEETGIERKRMRSDSQLRRRRITRRVPESAQLSGWPVADLPLGGQIINDCSGHSVI